MRVLFVEDDAMNRRVVRDMLGCVEVEMAEAENAQIGLQKFEDEAYDMVLMDLRMPGMDGLTAIRLIRARDDAKASIPIVVLTADTAPDLRDQCLSSGANELLLKPVDMDALFAVIGRILGSDPNAAILT